MTQKTERSNEFGDVVITESIAKQFDDALGVFANRDFKKGELIVKWNLKTLAEDEYQRLPEYERNNFVHKRNGRYLLYPEPERHVNRSKNPNAVVDFTKEADVALRNIKKGEEITILDSTKEDLE